MNAQNQSTNQPEVYRSKHYTPAYKPGNFGNWRLSFLPLGDDHGYFTKTWMVQNMPETGFGISLKTENYVVFLCDDE